MINKQKLFRFYDYWPWAMVLGIITIPCWVAYFHNSWTLPTGAWVTTITTMISAWAISIYRFSIRWQWIKSIFAYTDQGTALYGEIGTTNPEFIRKEFSKATEEVMSFWDGKLVNEKILLTPDLLSVINGSILGLSNKPMQEMNQPGYKGRLIRGYAIGSQMGIYFDPNDMESNIKVFKHELGHLCLDVAGVFDEESSHLIMNQNNFNY